MQSGTIETSSEFPSLKPFAAVAMVWGTFGVLLGGGLWFVAGWALAIADLYALAKIVASALVLVSSSGVANTGNDRVRLAVWGIAKLACLGGFLVFVMSAKEVPGWAPFAGLATLGVVPVVGGWIGIKQ